ncbi:MAG: hypothetical protein LCH32_01245 [Bacteroidetes bacterium]|jgi:hypothetical protein|nr:hypothetical protein [Bacteroidota bacterium]
MKYGTSIAVRKMKAFINPKKEPLTIERLKKFKGLECLSDAEAEETLLGIKTLSTLLIEFLKENQESKSNEIKQAA